MESDIVEKSFGSRISTIPSSVSNANSGNSSGTPTRAELLSV